MNFSKNNIFLLSFVFIALQLSPGFPLVLPMTAFILFVTYWQEKYRIINVYKKPLPRFGGNVHEAMVWFLLVTLLFHMCIGLWMYSC
mmetsp:Transcript_24277/g.18470  ORF Transcript_24277/g.18470 Transcript_24277/m.18470 type:complete len:87 (+) Transcript_24277:226-486(+)